MKYSELIQFDPIDEIIKFDKLGNEDYRVKLVRDFVCSKAYEERIIPQICAKLDLSATSETKGIQIVGNYGTGKSHLMSLFTIIAEDASYLKYLRSEKAKTWLRTIAGKYKVYRFELGNTQELWDIITYKIDIALASWGVDYRISNDQTPASYSEKLEKMLAAFEEKYPDKGFMLVIDEMLSYLKGRSQPDKINRDLAVLQALGQMSDRTRFRMVFGVQELIYRSPEFQFAREMLNRVNERYTDLTIQKEDVQFIVQQRLLQKDEHQKARIRSHLSQFTSMFPHLSNNMEAYVNLFPVHPSYFENFSLIRIGKSHREVLKTLSHKFEQMVNDTVPTEQPGLICYDSYWHDMLNNVDLNTDPDVGRVNDITTLVSQKIEENFTRGLAPKKSLAHRIVSAAAIKMLQADLSHANGVTAETLVNDLCYVDGTCENYDELVDLAFTNVLNKIVSATIGQYFEKSDNNNEYHLRIEGGVNYEQKIKDYASQMDDSQRDEYFFSFLAQVLPVEGETYRTNFRIWEHAIEWRTHNCYRKGYIFMGNPNERSTTQPKQQFYLYFMPIFNGDNYQREAISDSIYFLMNGLTDNFRQQVVWYGAAAALEGSASSDEKPRYKLLRDKYFKSSRDAFNSEFTSATQVEYMGNVQPISSIPVKNADSKIDRINDIASHFMDEQFEAENPHYPKFTMLSVPLSPQNRKGNIDLALKKIADPASSSRNGEAMLMALGLWEGGRLSTSGSQYARSLKAKLDAKEGQVLNRDEILEVFWAQNNEYVSIDFKLEADLQMLVIATMAALGEIELVLRGGNRINASTIASITTLNTQDYYSFSNICPPKGLNTPLIREILIGLLGSDRTLELDDNNSSLFADLISAARAYEEKIVRLKNDIRNGYSLADIEVISLDKARELSNSWDALKGICNQIQRYNTKAKLRNIPWPIEVVQKAMGETKASVENTLSSLQEMSKFRGHISYFYQAKSNIAQNNIFDANLYRDVDAALSSIKEMLSRSQTERSQHLQTFESLRARYADYYMDAYTKAHISAIDMQKKNALLAKDEYAVCNDVRDAAFINPSVFDSWKKRVDMLQGSHPSVTRDYILTTPVSQDSFNPCTANSKLPSIGSLGDELLDIYNDYVQQFREALEDPTSVRNIEMLSYEEKSLLESFKNSDFKLTHQNARPIVAIITKLQRSFHRVTISHDELTRKFSRPMKIDEAISAFREYINEQSRGKRPEDVRIIIK